MIERPVGFAALSAPFLAAAVELVPHFPGAQVAVATAAALTLAVGVLSFVQPSVIGLPNVGLGAALLVVGGATTAAPSAFGPYGPAILVGVLIGAPWVLVGYVTRNDEALGLRFLAYGVAVTWGLFLLADAPNATGTSVFSTASAYLDQFFALVAQQLQVFGGLLTGAATPPLPLNQFFDPVYAAFVAVSVVGLLLVTLRPQTGGRSPLPVAVRAYRGLDAERDLTGSYGFTPTQRDVFRERSTGEAPLATWPPGLEPVFYGAAAAGAFLVASYFASTWTVPAAIAGVAVAALWLIRTTDRPRPLPRPAAPPPHDDDSGAVSASATEPPTVPTAGAGPAPEEPTGTAADGA